MKKIVALMTSMIFVLTVGIVFAQETAKPAASETKAVEKAPAKKKKAAKKEEKKAEAAPAAKPAAPAAAAGGYSK
jgi:hypothetical protein